MIIEVNDAGDILIPAELVQAAPHTRLKANRQGNSVVLRLLVAKSMKPRQSMVDSLPILEGRITEPAMTLRREEIYGSDAR